MSKEKLIPEFRFPEFKDSGEWDVKTLGEVLIKNSKKNKNQKYSQVESVSNKFGFIKQDEYFKNRRVASKDTSNYYVIKKGYFAYNPSRIDVGSLAYKHNDEISIISPLYVSFKANNELINDYFLLSFFNSVTFTKQMIFEGGVRNTLNYDNLIQSKIPIPTIQEQQRIASCLSSLDEVIEAHSKKLELLKDHKKGLLQNLFPQEGENVPKVRFPEFEEDGEWIETTLEQVADYENGKAHEKDIDENGDYIVVNSKFISTEGETVKYSDTAFCPANLGDILMVLSDVPNGKAIAKCFYVDEENRYSVNQRICRITATDCDSRFLFYIMDRNAYFLSFDDGVKQTNLRKSDVLEFPFRIPTDPVEQTKIASCLSALDELITAQQEKIAQLQQHKKGLMQGLFPKIND